MPDQPAPPFTPPADWRSVDAADWARRFVHHAQDDPRIPLDWVVMTQWCDAMIQAGAAYARADRAAPTPGGEQ